MHCLEGCGDDDNGINDDTDVADEDDDADI